MPRTYHILGWGYVAICVTALWSRGTPARAGSSHAANTPAEGGSPAAAWFRQVRPYCNAVEVSVVLAQSSAPSGVEGTGYRAACFALAGRVDEARRVIDALPPDDRSRAAGVVFAVGHPVADAGDDRAAGPIMELVVDYWPNHYMALYHAGMAEYMLGQSDLATKSLTDFVRIYEQNDGWRSNALDVLARLRAGKRATRADLERPREP